MPLTPEERREINRQNSQHSTGPTSPEGKSRSRQNALKHGLRAETLALPGEDADALRELSDDWTDHYQPDSPAVRAALDRAVRATIQSHRSDRFHTAAVAEQVRNAEVHWLQDQTERVERLKADLLGDDPATALRALKRSAIGCRWLIAQWEHLGESFQRDGYWMATSESRTAIRLLGKRPDEIATDEAVYDLHVWNISACDRPSEGRIEWLLDPKRIPDTKRWEMRNGLPPRESCAGRIPRLIAAELAELKSTEQWLREAIEGPSRAGAGDRALLLGGEAGALYLRYERMHDGAFHRAVKVLEQDRKARAGEARPAPPPPKGLPMWHSPSPSEMLTMYDGLIAELKAAAPNEANAPARLEAGEGSPAERLARLEEMRGMALDMIYRTEGASGLAAVLGTSAPPSLAVS